MWVPGCFLPAEVGHIGVAIHVVWFDGQSSSVAVFCFLGAVWCVCVYVYVYVCVCVCVCMCVCLRILEKNKGIERLWHNTYPLFYM